MAAGQDGITWGLIAAQCLAGRSGEFMLRDSGFAGPQLWGTGGQSRWGEAAKPMGEREEVSGREEPVGGWCGDPVGSSVTGNSS